MLDIPLTSRQDAGDFSTTSLGGLFRRSVAISSSHKPKGVRMQQVSDMVKAFFEDYEKSSNTPPPELIASQYGNSFMFAGPQGVQAVRKEDFLKALPKRDGFFKAVGLTSSRIQSLEETRLDDNYILVKAYWKMQFENGPERPAVAEIAATYLLYQQGALLQIVLQLDHQDLTKKVQEFGAVR